MTPLGSLADRVRAPATAPEAGDPMAALLAHIREGSPYLSRLVDQDSARFSRLAAMSPEEGVAAIWARQAAVGPAVRDGTSTRDEAMRELRRNKDEAALLIALADLGRVWDVVAVTQALSEFADASVQSAVAMALAEAHAAGRIATADPARSGFVVLAFGKHGAGELNFSSDIDLVVFHDPAPEVAGTGASSKLYTRIAQSVGRILSDRTVDGYVHRVDYRLRPDPASTPPAVSLSAAYRYYETLGQNWERAAMIKARPVAGDLALGERFLADMQPFIWRKYFDFASIADIHAMKRQIHAVRGHGAIAVEGHDIKLGRGGIREAEFFVQTQQLVFGGRRRALRGLRTLDTLVDLHREAWITAEARDEMAGAYRFLREIEHRLQMVADEQTQRLPADPEALARFARFCGYADRDAFARALVGQAERVQHHYGLLFREGEDLASARGDLVFTGATLDAATVETLRRIGFREPEVAAETVRGWHFGRRAAVTSPRAREVLTELTPPLLEALAGSADPDTALRRLDEAFGRMPAAVELLTILRSHDRLRTLFADLLGSAPRLAQTVAARPHVLDAVLDPGFAAPARDEAAAEQELAALVGVPNGMEDFLDRLRDANRQMQFATGARFLSGVLSPAEAGAAYAAIARAAIRAALAQVSELFAMEHGRVARARFAVLGLGRLGAGDLTAASDLDLVVLYDFDAAERTSDGTRPLDAVTYHIRLTQRLIAALTAPTRRGTLFEIDLRLRPSGSKGPLASQFAGFRAYHAGEAQLWEHMALTRARGLAGDPGLIAEAEGAIAEVIARPRDADEVFREVVAMRTLIETEKGRGGPWDLKIAPGGLIDLDFLAQAIVLADAAAHPGLVGLPVPAVFETAARTGRLSAAEASLLVEAHRLVDDVIHWQRLTAGEGSAATDAAVLSRLAAFAGDPGPEELRARLDEARSQVRAIFRAVLGAKDLVPG